MPAFCRRLLRFLPLLTAGAAIGWAAGCGGASDQPTGEGTNHREMRIVSLSPAISRTLMDFELADRIVGRSAFCDCLDQSIPVVGDLHQVNYERLIELKPTHVLLQPAAGGTDRKLAELAGTHGWKIGQWEGLNTIDDIEGLVHDLPWLLCEDDDEQRLKMAGRVAELVNEIAGALSPGPGETWRGTTLIVHTVQPVGVFGHGTYLHDVLTRLGGINAVSSEGWTELSLEDIATLNPQAIVIIRPGGDADADPMEVAGPLGRLQIDAATHGRIAVLTHPDALRPCTGIIGVAAEMRRLMRKFCQSDEPVS
jgi:ABC-type hemin transport system substrate-binding protein